MFDKLKNGLDKAKDATGIDAAMIAEINLIVKESTDEECKETPANREAEKHMKELVKLKVKRTIEPILKGDLAKATADKAIEVAFDKVWDEHMDKLKAKTQSGDVNLSSKSASSSISKKVTSQSPVATVGSVPEFDVKCDDKDYIANLIDLPTNLSALSIAKIYYNLACSGKNHAVWMKTIAKDGIRFGKPERSFESAWKTLPGRNYKYKGETETGDANKKRIIFENEGIDKPINLVLEDGKWCVSSMTI